MSSLATDTAKLPPMLVQYLEYKGRYPDALLFFQVGDFYELFFDDAITVSRALNLTLTSRDKNSTNPVPMCGVPIAVIEGYIDRLLGQRYSVALVSQKAVAEGHKGPVERGLDRIITPGIQILSHSSVGRSASYVAAIMRDARGESALCYSEVQSGIILVRDGLDQRRLLGELQRISPAELIVPNMQGLQKTDRRNSWVRELEVQLSDTSLRFRPERGLDSQGGRSQSLSSIAGFQAQSPEGKRSVKLLVDYIDEVTAGMSLPLVEVRSESDSGVLLIDSMTRANLEIVRNNRDGGGEGSLFELLDRTITSGGAKLLRQWLLAPLANQGAILERQRSVSALKMSWERGSLLGLLERVVDCERIAVRIELGVVTPRELAALRDTLEILPQIKSLLGRVIGADEGATERSGILSQIESGLDLLESLQRKLNTVLSDDPPLSIINGGIIREGFDGTLDQLRVIGQKGKLWIDELEQSERERSAIPTLKIKYTGVFGYFIEVTNANLAKVPSDYVRKQTTANSERFFTEELKKREIEIVSAGDKALIRERDLFCEFRGDIKEFAAALRSNALLLSQLDVLAALAELAEREGYRAPEITTSDILIITNGKHPVLLQMLRNDFIANSVQVGGSDARCLIVTGPNMGGKSTYLRQTALLIIMAQIGSFVPAEAAQIGIVDRIFARIGASDNLREGESTFMVEMREASSILAHATERSLVLVDEIGRGTATLDGLALAQAILEWMVVQTKARVLFATHFHELTLLEASHPTISNFSVGSAIQNGSVIFTHQIVPGAANRSYGLEVAERAGLPAGLMQRARVLHEELIRNECHQGKETLQLSLFAPMLERNRIDTENKIDRLRETIRALDTNSLTPRDALNLIFDFQQQLTEETANAN